MLAALVIQEKNLYGLWLAATLCNTLGALLNWVLGKYLLHFQQASWFPFKPGQLKKAQKLFHRYGEWTLLFSWFPVIGDPLTFLAGTLNTPFFRFFFLVLVGKGLRYAFVIFISLHIV